MLKKLSGALFLVGLLGLLSIFAVGSFSATARGEQTVEVQPQTRSDLKVGYVNLERSLNAFQPYLDAQEDLREYQQGLQEKIDEREAEIEQLQEGLQFLAQERQQEVYEQLQMMMQEYRTLIQESEMQLDVREEELLRPIRERVKVAIGTVGEEMGLEVIKQFDGRVTDVLWVSSQVDLTDAIIQHLQEIE